jgi:hypothetical protein
VQACGGVRKGARFKAAMPRLKDSGLIDFARVFGRVQAMERAPEPDMTAYLSWAEEEEADEMDRL